MDGGNVCRAQVWVSKKSLYIAHEACVCVCVFSTHWGSFSLWFSLSLVLSVTLLLLVRSFTQMKSEYPWNINTHTHSHLLLLCCCVCLDRRTIRATPDSNNCCDFFPHEETLAAIITISLTFTQRGALRHVQSHVSENILYISVHVNRVN